MRPVITFLDKVHRENQLHKDDPDNQVLRRALHSTTDISVSVITPTNTNTTFVAPKPRPPRPSAEKRISYLKPEEQIKRAQEALGVTSRKKVGEKTFDYFYDRECEK